MDSKGKSLTTSVPSFRFHTNGEELEQLYVSDSDTEKDALLNTEDVKSSKDDAVTGIKDSPKREPSPMKEVISRLSKRSSSVDAGIVASDNSPVSSSSDRWRLFSEFKGKITKTVEEKISEIKSGSKSSDHDKDNVDNLRNKFATSKDNSSVSDSEDISASESSTSKFADIEMSSANGTEDEVEMPNEPDTTNLLKPKEISLVPIETPKKTKRIFAQRFKTVDGNRASLSVEFKNEKVENAEVVIRHNEVDNAVEAMEDLIYLPPSIVHTKIDDCRPQTALEEKTAHKQINERYFRGIYGHYKEISTIIVLIAMFYVRTLSEYSAGFISGVGLSITLVSIVMYFGKNFKASNETKKAFTPVFATVTPIVKEYEPIYKFEGWLNEYPGKYDVTSYHVNATHSVWVCLEGSRLKLSTGRGIRVSKRAMWNEASLHPSSMSLTDHRVHKMNSAKIVLLPEGLTKKRYWSKKYPICLEFTKMPKEYHEAPPKLSDEDSVDELGDKSCNSSPTFKSKRRKSFDTISMEQVKEQEDVLVVHELIDNLSSGLNEVCDNNSPVKTPRPEIKLDITPLHENKTTDSVLNITLLDSGDADVPEDDEVSTEWDTVDDSNDEVCRIYLFARTDREKEEWFNRFVAASHYEQQNMDTQIESTETPQNTTENPLAEGYATPNSSPSHISVGSDVDDHITDYRRFMARFQVRNSNEASNENNTGVDMLMDVMWVNALMGRILFDAVRQTEWVEALQQRIQRKLSSIKLPYFMEELLITDLDLGKTVPMIHRASRPTMDARGVWVDLDITYDGCMRATLKTKLNLMKLKKQPDGDVLEPEKKPENVDSGSIPAPVYDSDLDDSAESSSEDDVSINASSWVSNSASLQSAPAVAPSATGGNTSKKLLRMVDKIAASKYFQQATENKFIKRAMEGVSRTELKLCVELRSVAGTLALNIPPPPSHRLWIGFRKNPQIWLNAKPVVGERSLNFNQITSWIENKLQQEFQKILVLPNMEDFVIPIMNIQLPK